MQAIAVLEGEPGPYAVKVRPSLDDGTAVGAAVGVVNRVVSPIAGDSFVVLNIGVLTVALTEGQLDAAYVTAIGTTNNNSIDLQPHCRRCRDAGSRLLLSVVSGGCGRWHIFCPWTWFGQRSAWRSNDGDEP